MYLAYFFLPVWDFFGGIRNGRERKEEESAGWRKLKGQGKRIKSKKISLR